MNCHINIERLACDMSIVLVAGKIPLVARSYLGEKTLQDAEIDFRTE